jgi:hypothetical protein
MIGNNATIAFPNTKDDNVPLIGHEHPNIIKPIHKRGINGKLSQNKFAVMIPLANPKLIMPP